MRRAVLIDAGIRLWGVPRVFAAAVALSLVAAADRNIRVDAYRACGRSVEPVALTQREGLIAHLEALEPDAHPGDALGAFLAAVSKTGDLLDAVVITGEDAAADRAFQQAIAALASARALAGHRQPRGPLPPGLLGSPAEEGPLRGPGRTWKGCCRRQAARSPRLLDTAALGLPAILQQEAVPAVVVPSARRSPPGLGGAGAPD